MAPTDELLKQSVKRAHLQVATELDAVDLDLPTLQPTDYGFTKEENFSILTLTTVSREIVMVPDELLKLIRCSRRSWYRFNSNRCSCKNATLSCTVFCACQSRHNYKIATAANDDADDDDDDADDDNADD